MNITANPSPPVLSAGKADTVASALAGAVSKGGNATAISQAAASAVSTSQVGQQHINHHQA
jgi:hypothetical protein